MGDTGVGLFNAADRARRARSVRSLRSDSVADAGWRKRVVVSLAGWGAPLVLIGACPVPALALAALFVTGVSNAVLDVSGFTLVQRGVRNEDRDRRCSP